MAKDKVVDSAVLDAGLVSIADAIREKTGETEALSFPAGMAAAIAGIETGGGGTVKYGTLSLSGISFPGTTTYTIDTGLESVWGLVVWTSDPTTRDANKVLLSVSYEQTTGSYSTRRATLIYLTNSTNAAYIEDTATNVDENTKIIRNGGLVTLDFTDKKVYIANGVHYHWLAWGTMKELG